MTAQEIASTTIRALLIFAAGVIVIAIGLAAFLLFAILIGPNT